MLQADNPDRANRDRIQTDLNEIFCKTPDLITIVFHVKTEVFMLKII
jgi:hypothetical protein